MPIFLLLQFVLVNKGLCVCNVKCFLPHNTSGRQLPSEPTAGTYRFPSWIRVKNKDYRGWDGEGLGEDGERQGDEGELDDEPSLGNPAFANAWLAG